MALRTSQLNSFKKLNADFRLLLNPILALIIVPTLFVLAFGALVSFTANPASTSFSQNTQASFAMTTSGALTLYLNEATVDCSANAVQLNVPALNGTNGYEIALLGSSFGNTNNSIGLNTQNELNLNLVDSNNTAYRSFVAEQGQITLNASGQSSMTAFLYDNQGQELFLNAHWTCA